MSVLCVSIFVIIILALLPSAYAAHLDGIPNITVHPTAPFFSERHELYIIHVWIPYQQEYDLGNEPCIFGYEITPKGTCTSIELHWNIYSLYLISELPDVCPPRAVSCILWGGIYILMGHHDDPVGAHSLLWELITELKVN